MLGIVGGVQMKVADAEEKVAELSDLIESQQQLVDQLTEAGRDTTSAKIVLDSLRTSMSLAIQNWHLARCSVGPDQVTNFNWVQKNRFDIVSNALSSGKENAMTINSWFLDDVVPRNDLVQEQADPTSSSENTAEPIPSHDFEFRPLTEQEKKEFVESLDAEGKRLLEMVEHRVARQGRSAA